jgi:ornithine decarboxylase
MLFYAMKANPRVEILEEVLKGGGNVEVASPREIEIAIDCGFRPDQILYSNPVRKAEHIEAARRLGVDWFVYDSVVELDKLCRHAPRANALFRISVSNPDCLIRLSEKFGADPSLAEAMIGEGISRGLQVRGVSFHVGSQTYNPYAYVDGIVAARRIFNLLGPRGINLDTLDIGGGFPVEYLESVMPPARFFEPIRSSLEAYFSGANVVAEPGRIIAADAVTAIVSVISKCEKNGTQWYFLDDGLYGAFSGMIYDKCKYRLISSKKTPPRPCVVAGPTCDSFDMIYTDYSLPELDVGDILLIPSMGAYCEANVQSFNGFPPPSVFVLD